MIPPDPEKSGDGPGPGQDSGAPQRSDVPARKLKITVSYDGTGYSGWQRQSNAPSVQQVIEEALNRVTGSPVRIHGAGRTDAGVHAIGQTAHFTTSSGMVEPELKKALNAVLPDDIRVRSLERTDESFHARFSALGKTYAYAIRNHPDDSVTDRHYHWHVRQALDVSSMREAASLLLGCRDFRAFASVPTGKDSRRTLRRLDLQVLGPGILVFAEADGFLWKMVRGLVGSLVEVGKGAREPTWPRSLQDAPDRGAGAPSAPAKGLTLMWVDYGGGPPDPSDLSPCLSGFFLAAR